MKYIQSKFILLVASALIPFMSAQTAPENETLLLKRERFIGSGCISQSGAEKSSGSVSVVNYDELTKRNYNTYSMDNMQGYVGGWNGASLWGMDSHSCWLTVYSRCQQRTSY